MKTHILWEALDTNAGDRVHPFGVMDAVGEPRRVSRVLTRELAAQAAELRQSHDIAIAASLDRLVSSADGAEGRASDNGPCVDPRPRLS